MIIQVNWKKLAFYLATALGTGILSGLCIMGSMQIYQDLAQPPFSPPSWLFPVVWGILYILMGISAYWIGMSESDDKKSALLLYWVQLIINFFWPIIFFRMQSYLFALIWLVILWIVVFLMVLRFIPIHKWAGYLQIPYLVWLTFALYLNIGVVLLNGS